MRFFYIVPRSIALPAICLINLVLVSFSVSHMFAQTIDDEPTTQEEIHRLFLPQITGQAKADIQQEDEEETTESAATVSSLVEISEWQPPHSQGPNPDQGVYYDSATRTETLLPLGFFGQENSTANDSQLQNNVLGRPTITVSQGLPPAVIAAGAGFSSLSRVNETQYPWSTVVRLEVEHDELPANQIFVCSGILIDPKVVLTKGNCIYNHSKGYGWATNIRAVPGYENGTAPYGDANDVTLSTVTGWTRDANFDYDYGLVILNRPIGYFTGYAGYSSRSDNTFFTSTTFQNPGYPGGSPYNLKLLYNRSGRFDRAETYSVYQGGSANDMWGSPAIFSYNGGYNAIAILSHTRGTETGYTRITSAKFDFIQNKIIEKTPTSPDLIPLRFRSSSTSLVGGTSSASMSFRLYNYSSKVWTGTVNYKIYISSNDNISEGDIEIAAHSYGGRVEPKDGIVVNVPATTIPETVSGNYYMGIVLTSSDADINNNDTDTWDAHFVSIRQPLRLAVSPTTMSFNGAVGASLSARTISVLKSGDGSFQWSATDNQSWLTLSGASGTNSGSFTVNVNTAGLSSGLYSGEITVSAPGATPSSIKIPVTLNLTKPTFEIFPTTLAYSAAVGGYVPEGQNLFLSLSGSSQLTWNASTNRDWIVLNKESGQGSGQIRVTVNPLELAAGLYDGQITFNTPGAEPEMITVDLQLDLVPSNIVPNPTLLSFTAIAGGDAPAASPLNFSFNPAGQFAWYATGGADWIQVTPETGTGPGAVMVSVDPTGFGPGLYEGTVDISLTNNSEAVPLSVPLIMEITRGSGILTVAPTALSFVALSGENPPPGQSITIGDTNSQPFTWNAVPNEPWLLLNNASGQAPGTTEIIIDHSTLTPGNYRGSIIIYGPESGNYDQFEQPILISETVTINLQVGNRNGGQPILQAAPQLLSFEGTLGDTTPLEQEIVIANAGDGTLNWQATSDQSWLTPDKPSGTGENAVTIRVTASGLAPGIHTGQIRIQESGGNSPAQIVNVTLTLRRPATLAVDGKNLVFTYVLGEAASAPSSIRIRNQGDGTFQWTAIEEITWLSLSQSSGRPPATVDATVNPANLAPGRYSGSITIAGDAASSPQSVNAVLYVQQGPELGLSHSNLSFDALSGDNLANAATVDIKNTGRGQLSWQIDESIPWLSLSQTSGSIVAFSRQTLQVSIDTAGLSPRGDPYNGQLIVRSPNGGSSPQTINVSLVVASKARYCRIEQGAADYIINTSQLQLYLSEVRSTATPNGGCDLAGKLQILLKRIPKATIDIEGKVDANNNFVGSAPRSLDLGIAGIKFTLAAGFTIDDERGLVSKGGFIQMPANLGGKKKPINTDFTLVLGPKGLTINGNQSWDLPNIDWGGFQVGKGKAKLTSIRSDGNFDLEVTGVITVAVTGTSGATANIRLRLDYTGIRYGAIDAFTLRGVAGLDLAVKGADLSKDRLIIKEGEFVAPKLWGGAKSKVYDLMITNRAELIVGGVELWLPKLDTGQGNGVKLSSIHGGFKSRKDGNGRFIGYEIWADATLGLPDTSSQSNCSIRVKIVLYTDTNGASVMELASADHLMSPTVGNFTPVSYPTQAQPALLATTNAPSSTPDAIQEINGLRLRELTLGWRCQPGIALGTTGLFISGIQGTILLDGGLEQVELILWIESGYRVGKVALMSAVPKATIRVKSPTFFKFDGPVYLLKYKVQDTKIEIRPRYLSGSVTNYSPVIDYSLAIEASQPKGQRFYLKGSGWTKVQVKKGDIFEECANLPDPTLSEPFRVRRHCLYFPPSTAKILGADGYIDNDGIEAAVSYSKYRAGAYFDFASQDLSFFFKGTTALYTAAQIHAARQHKAGLLAADAALIDAAVINAIHTSATGDVLVSTMVTPPDLGMHDVGAQNATAAPTYPAVMQRDAIFSLVKVSDLMLQATLVGPDGREYTRENLSDSIRFEESVGISTTQQIFVVSQAAPGEWTLKLQGDTESEGYFVVSKTSSPPATISRATVTSITNANQVDVGWQLYTEDPTATVNLYAASGEVTATVTITDPINPTVREVRELFAGVPIATELSTSRDGSPTTHTVDLSGLPSGEYALWIEVNGEADKPAKRYLEQNGQIAKVTIDHSNSFPTVWNPTISIEVDIKAGEMNVVWQRNAHPDIDGYAIRMQSTDPLDPSSVFSYTTTLGNVGDEDQVNAIIDMIEPGWTYQLAVGAIDYESNRTIWSPQTTIVVPQPDFVFRMLGANYQVVTDGNAIAIPLAIELSESLPHPVVLQVDYAETPGGLYAEPSTNIVTETTTSGDLALATWTSDSMKPGIYIIPVVARSGVLEHRLNIPIEVKAVGENLATGKIYLPLIARQ